MELQASITLSVERVLRLNTKYWLHRTSNHCVWSP